MAVLNAIGVQTLAVSSAVVSLTLPSGKTPGPSHALLQNTGSNVIRWTADGTNPSATVGQQLVAGATIQFMDPTGTYSGVLKFFKAIRESADSTLEIAYFAT